MSILEADDGKIWFTRSSLSDYKGPLCEVRGDQAVCHGPEQGGPIPSARQISKDADGNFWTLSDNTLMRWSQFWAWVRVPRAVQATLVMLAASGVPTKNVWP